MNVTPYLFFEGRCEEALNFYRTALDAEIIMMMRYKEAPDQSASMPDRSGEKIMHATLRIGDGTIGASDGGCTGTCKFEGFSLTVNATSDAEAKRFFDALADGGKVEMPLTKTFWSSGFGMLVDRFGVKWMVNVWQPQ